jgi:hypothetical protein
MTYKISSSVPFPFQWNVHHAIEQLNRTSATLGRRWQWRMEEKIRHASLSTLCDLEVMLAGMPSLSRSHYCPILRHCLVSPVLSCPAAFFCCFCFCCPDCQNEEEPETGPFLSWQVCNISHASPRPAKTAHFPLRDELPVECTDRWYNFDRSFALECTTCCGLTGWQCLPVLALRASAVPPARTPALPSLLVAHLISYHLAADLVNRWGEQDGGAEQRTGQRRAV